MVSRALLKTGDKTLTNATPLFQTESKQILGKANNADNKIVHQNGIKLNFGDTDIFKSNKSHSLKTLIYPQLKINKPHDKFEQEADKAAEKIMQKETVDNSHTLKSDEISTADGLDSQTRDFFESRFGYNFSNVRIHSDSKANKYADNLGARAYTFGNEIFFGSGEYNSSSRKSRKLLAHELAHVVQQKPGLSYHNHGSLGASLSATPQNRVQPKLVATGDGAGFAALANSIIGVQFEVLVSPAGVVSLRSTSVQGPPTPEAQELVSVLQSVINDSNTTTIEFIHGVSSTRPSDARFMVGSFPQGKVDLDDVSAFGTQATVGLGQGRTAGALLSHEITEQYRKQIHGEQFPAAHSQGEAAESLAVGGVRGTMTTRQLSSTTIEFTVPYTYPGGRVVEVKWDVTNGNVSNIRRRVVP